MSPAAAALFPLFFAIPSALPFPAAAGARISGRSAKALDGGSGSGIGGPSLAYVG